MRIERRLAGLAVTAWAAWLGLMAVLVAMLAARLGHPHFLPVTALFGLLIVAWLGLAFLGAWAVVRGPKRRRALGWVLVGSAPFLFMAGHVLIGLSALSGRNHRVDLPLKMLVPFGESLFDLEARFRYPQRTAGEKVVSIATPQADARSLLAAMDQHVRGIEVRLGRKVTQSIHWVRGPLLATGSYSGRAIYALCTGLRPEEAVAAGDGSGLSYLDRHEVAHCVLAGFSPTSLEPPAVLSEGWADANMGMGADELELRASEYRARTGVLSLRELTGPKWYGLHEFPAYCHGAPLVNYILRTYGPERFLTLFGTCREASFADDCRRVLGVDIDRLDADYWAAIERNLHGEEPWVRRSRLMKLGPGVDAGTWKAFLDEYKTAVPRLLTPYRETHLITEEDFPPIGKLDESSAFNQRLDYRSSGPFRSAHVRWPNRERVYLAHPERSIEAHRQASDQPWEVFDSTGLTPARLYHREFNQVEWQPQAFRTSVVLMGVADYLSDLLDSSQIRVSRVERFEGAGHPFVRVRLEDTTAKQRQSPWKTLTVVMAADRLFAVVEVEFEDRDGTTMKEEVAYDDHEGIPVLRSQKTTTLSASGKVRERNLRVIEQTFGPSPESAFDPDTLVSGPRVTAVNAPDTPPVWAAWSGVGASAAVTAGMVSLAGGLVLLRLG